MNKKILISILGATLGLSGLYMLSVINGYLTLGVFLMIWGNNICEWVKK